MFLAWSRNIACPEPRVVARHVVASMHVCYLPAFQMHPSINLESRHRESNNLHSRCHSGVHRRGHHSRQVFLSCLRLLRRSAKPPPSLPLLWEHMPSFSVPYSLRLCNDCNDTRTRNALTLPQPVLTFTALYTPTRSILSSGKTFTMPNRSVSQRARRRPSPSRRLMDRLFTRGMCCL